jgi:hypothetical protein
VIWPTAWWWVTWPLPAQGPHRRRLISSHMATRARRPGREDGEAKAPGRRATCQAAADPTAGPGDRLDRGPDLGAHRVIQPGSPGPTCTRSRTSPRWRSSAIASHTVSAEGRPPRFDRAAGASVTTARQARWPPAPRAGRSPVVGRLHPSTSTLCPLWAARTWRPARIEQAAVAGELI